MTTSETASSRRLCSAGSSGTAGERADILETLRTHRFFLRHTVEGLTDEQARLSPTASELTLGGLIKHVAATESGWVDFVERGTEAMAMPEGEFDPSSELAEEWANEFRLLPDETLADVLAGYERWPPARTRWSSRSPTSTGAPAAAGAVVRAGRDPLGAAGVPAHRGRDRPARRARRHHPGDDRRPEDDGLSRRSARPRHEGVRGRAGAPCT